MTRHERRDGRAPSVPAHVVGGRRAVLEAIRASVAREVLVARGSRSTQDFATCSKRPRRPGWGPRGRAGRARPHGPDHQGVAARVRTPEPIGESELATWPFAEDALAVVLDGITDPQNLGAAARSAEAAGAAMLVTRKRRAADVTSAVVRASAGALLHLSHARVANIPRALERLQGNGFTVVGLSEHAERTVFEESCPEGRIAVVLGDEGEGLARLTREACDLLVRLPMRGRVGSLNASASLAAALYAFVLPARYRA
jgi:23S rRNA (guanosine2251-2'-O)-methyltransferase